MPAEPAAQGHQPAACCRTAVLLLLALLLQEMTAVRSGVDCSAVTARMVSETGTPAASTATRSPACCRLSSGSAGPRRPFRLRNFRRCAARSKLECSSNFMELDSATAVLSRCLQLWASWDCRPADAPGTMLHASASSVVLRSCCAFVQRECRLPLTEYGSTPSLRQLFGFQYFHWPSLKGDCIFCCNSTAQSRDNLMQLL